MAKFPIDKVIQKVLDGIDQAEKDYVKWSNGLGLEYAPEYFITVWISRKIRGIQSHDLWITLENSIRNALEEAKGTKRGRPSSRLQLTGRYDIVVWRKNNTPRYVIEVKHRVTGYNQTLQSDVSRICEAFSNSKLKMQAGFLAFYTYGWAREYRDGTVKEAITIVEQRVDNIYNAIKDDSVTDRLKVSSYEKILTNEQGFATLAVVIRFDRASR